MKMSSEYKFWPPYQQINSTPNGIVCTTQNDTFIEIVSFNDVNVEYICGNNCDQVTKQIGIDELFNNNVNSDNKFMYYDKLLSFVPPQSVPKEYFAHRIQQYIYAQFVICDFTYIKNFEVFDGIFHFGVIAFQHK